MREKIMALFMAGSVCLSSMVGTFASPASGTRTAAMSAVYTQTAPELDGDKDAAYSAAAPIAVNTRHTGEVIAPDGAIATADASIVFDRETLYLFIEVADPTPKYNDSGATILRDVEGVNFMFDFLNTADNDYIPGSKDPVAGEQGRIQTNFIANHNGNAVYTGGSGNLNSHVMTDGRAFTGDFSTVLKQTDKGYNVEMQVKMSDTLKEKISTQPNPAIGLGIQLNDDTNDSFEGNNSGRDYVMFSDIGIDGEWIGSGATAGSRGFPDVTLENRCAVSVGSLSGGTITCDVTEGFAGQQAHLTVTPDAGKVLKPGSLRVNGEMLSGTSFPLPVGRAEITAQFIDTPAVPADGLIAATYGSAVLDGQKDVTYGAASVTPVNIDYLTGQPYAGNAATAQTTAVFDKDFLYFFAEVTDNTPVYDVDPASVIKDIEGFNIFLDYLNTPETDYTGWNFVPGEQGRIQANFVASRSGNARYDGGNYLMNDKGPFELEGVLVQTDHGYNVEIKVALSSQLKNKILTQENPTVGVGYQVNDIDTSTGAVYGQGNNNGRTNVLFSHEGINYEWTNDTTYGGSRGFQDMTLNNDVFSFSSITVSPSEGGTVTASAAKAAQGAVISLNITPEEGMQLKPGSLKANGLRINGTTFTMPNTDVVITAEFEKNSSSVPEGSIKVVSQNILNDAVSYDYDHGNTRVTNTVRAARMGKLIGDEIHPDSIGFQEVYGNGRGWARLLAENFPDYDWVGFGRDFTGSLDTTKEDYANDVSSGEATPIFYLKDKYDVVESGTWWISKTPGINPGGTDTPADKDAAWNAEYKMTMTWAVLKNKQTGETYAHVNSHLDPAVEKARSEGMKVITKKINELAYLYGGSLPVVVTGDWNCNQYSQAYKNLVSNAEVKMADAMNCAPLNEVYNQGGTFPNFGHNQPDGGFAIDIAFTSYENMHVDRYEVLRQAVDAGDGSGEGCLSDHYGVYIAFTTGKASEEVRPVPPKPDENNHELSAAYGSAKLDGVKDSAYSYSKTATVQTTPDGGTAGSGQATGEVTALYDANYLYCFAEVTDPTISDKLGLPEERDDMSEGVCFFFDFLNTPETDKLYQVDGEQGGIRIGYAAATGKILIPELRRATMPFEYSAVKTDKGYNIELRVELSASLKAKVNRDKDIAIGIGYQINDDQNSDGVRDTVCFSTTGINDEWLPVATGGGCTGFSDLYLISNNKKPGEDDSAAVSSTASDVSSDPSNSSEPPMSSETSSSIPSSDTFSSEASFSENPSLGDVSSDGTSSAPSQEPGASGNSSSGQQGGQATPVSGSQNSSGSSTPGTGDSQYLLFFPLALLLLLSGIGLALSYRLYRKKMINGEK